MGHTNFRHRLDKRNRFQESTDGQVWRQVALELARQAPARHDECCGERCEFGSRVLHPHLELTLPVVRAVNPVSGTNWEGVGVHPDVAAPAEDALAVAERLARAAVAAREGLSPALRRELAAADQ